MFQLAVQSLLVVTLWYIDYIEYGIHYWLWHRELLDSFPDRIIVDPVARGVVAAAVVVVVDDDVAVVVVVVEVDVAIDLKISIDHNLFVHYCDDDDDYYYYCLVHSIDYYYYWMGAYDYPMNVYEMNRSFCFASHSDSNSSFFHWDFHFLDSTSRRYIFMIRRKRIEDQSFFHHEILVTYYYDSDCYCNCNYHNYCNHSDYWNNFLRYSPRINVLIIDNVVYNLENS